MLIMVYNLFSKLKVLKIDENTIINILNYIKMLDFFLNECMTCKISVKIHVTVAYVDIS